MDDFKEKLAGIVGRQNLIDDSKTLEQYSRDGSFATPMMPRLVVKVKSADEVQKIVKLAQPLVTVYQYEVRDAINPKHLCGSYYRTLTPEKYKA